MAWSRKSAILRAVLASGRRWAASCCRKRVGVEGQAHQVLAKPVVNVLADAGLLAVADLENLALQAFALGDVLLHADIMDLAAQVERADAGFGSEDRAVFPPVLVLPGPNCRLAEWRERLLR